MERGWIAWWWPRAWHSYHARWLRGAVKAVWPPVGGFWPVVLSLVGVALSGYLTQPTEWLSSGGTFWVALKVVALLVFVVFVIQLILEPRRMDKARLAGIEAVERERLRLEGELQDRHRRESLINALGEFMQEGLTLQERCADVAPALGEEAERWNKRVERFLDDNLGTSYVPRFANFAGLPTPTAAPHVWIANLTVWGALDTRLARLEQFIQELSQ